MNYPALENLLVSVFSAETGLTDPSAALDSALRNSSYRAILKEELRIAFADEELSWAELLERYSVYPADTEEDAKGYVKKLLWDPIFGP